MKQSFYAKVKDFVKQHMYGILVSFCVVTLVFVLTITAISSLAKTPTLDEPSDEVVSPAVIVFTAPVQNGTIGMGYAEDELIYHKTLQQWQTHQAIDYVAPAGTEVVAAYDGEVLSVENTMLEGVIITIQHEQNLITKYASLDETTAVKKGDKVTKGQVIGKVGTTAMNEVEEGPHVHFEVWLKDSLVDPTNYLTDDKK